jgi:hypothetical protein
MPLPAGTRHGPYEILLVVMGVSLSLCCTDKSPTRPDRIAPSSAAREETTLDNRLLTVTRTGATFRSECSNGVIEGAILLDGTGHFDVLGTYQIQAGPVVLPRPARYVGFAIGETLTLTVMLAEDNQTFGSFTLTFGQVPQIGNCPIV